MTTIAAVNLTKKLIAQGLTNEEIRNHPKFIEQRRRHKVLAEVNLPNDRSINTLRAQMTTN